MPLPDRLLARSTISPISARDLAVLHLTGRLGMVMGATIAEVLYPDLHPTSVRRILRGLEHRKLMWRTSRPIMDSAGRSRGRAAHVYGLTEDGRTLLAEYLADLHDDSLRRLLARSRQAPAPPPRLVVETDTYLSDWGASLLHEIRRTPLLTGVYLQRRYEVLDPAGASIQTIGLLVVLVFESDPVPVQRPSWDIPWLPSPIVAGPRRVARLAVEFDPGLASIRNIFDLAHTYRHLSDQGLDRRLLGGPLRPVLITQPGRRARAAAEVWMSAWPGSPAVLTNTERTCHATLGVLWGEYLALKDNPVQPTTLLGSLLGPPDQWLTHTRSTPPAPR